MLFSYSDSLQYLLFDFGAYSSPYGRFVPEKGFEMISYPRLFLSSNSKPIVNPSFLPDLALIIHDSVHHLLYPEIHEFLFSKEFQNATDILANGPLWDFGKIHVFVITVIEEIKDNDFNAFMANYAPNRMLFWNSKKKELQQTLPSQKQVELHPLFVPLSKIPTLSLLFAENLELVSSNNTMNRKDMHLVIHGQSLLQQIERNRESILEEAGVKEILHKAGSHLGKAFVVPVFV